ncbi:MAG TPA: hypothetical protein VLA77_02460 [Candidatus Saccharimonadales bacterium]|nr:hypothetical protein [Candidatus Saccharimonadales bacterium]
MPSTPVVNGGWFGLIISIMLVILSLRAIREAASAWLSLALAIIGIGGSAAVISSVSRPVNWAATIACTLVATVITWWLLYLRSAEDFNARTGSVMLLCIIGPTTTAAQGAYQLRLSSGVLVGMFELACFAAAFVTGVLILHELRVRSR